MRVPVYLDHAASCPIDPSVLERMAQVSKNVFANSASRYHLYGWEADRVVEDARRQIASLIGCESGEIVFTSGATEGNNWILKSISEAFDYDLEIISSKIEHKSVLAVLDYLESKGVVVKYADVGEDGRVQPESIEALISPRTRLVSAMIVNHDSGIVQPFKEIGDICARHQILFHSDATQGMGKIKIDLSSVQIDFLTASSHKFYGPKGVGFVFESKHAFPKLGPLHHGGGHEDGRRSGSLNTVGIGSMAFALEKAFEQMADEDFRLRHLSKIFLESLRAEHEVTLNGDCEYRLPGHMNIRIHGVYADHLMTACKEVAFSIGSACDSRQRQPSYVLKAMGIDNTAARQSVRISMGRFNTVEEIEFAARRLATAGLDLRASDPKVPTSLRRPREVSMGEQV